MSTNKPDAVTIADHLDKAARGVRSCLWRLEDSVEGGSFEPDPRVELEMLLKRLYIQVMTALDHLNLAASRFDLAKAWAGFIKSGLREFTYYPEPGVAVSEAYDYLDSVIDAIRAVEPRGPIATESRDNEGELRRLEKFLENTNYTVQSRSVVPTKEGDVQRVMDQYLEFVYGSDYRRQFSIPGAVKNFRPDSGIRSLQAVIEFKFANNAQELKTATSGLFEDAAGYKASADWKRYYSVIYMTGAWGTKEQLLASFEQAGMIDWTPILVIGSGIRPAKTRKVARRVPRKALAKRKRRRI